MIFEKVNKIASIGTKCVAHIDIKKKIEMTDEPGLKVSQKFAPTCAGPAVTSFELRRHVVPYEDVNFLLN